MLNSSQTIEEQAKILKEIERLALSLSTANKLKALTIINDALSNSGKKNFSTEKL